MNREIIIDDTTIEEEPRSIWKRLLAILVLAHIGGWVFTYFFIGPPETHLIYYAIMPAIITLILFIMAFSPVVCVDLH